MVRPRLPIDPSIPMLDLAGGSPGGPGARAEVPALPVARGPLSTDLLDRLVDGRPLAPPRVDGIDALVDDDLHLALWCCYELHHHGFAGVDDSLEWDPQVLAFRSAIEAAFEAALRAEQSSLQLPSDPRLALRLVLQWAGPSLSGWMDERATIAHLREFAVHRSAYQLKEADGHTWAIPRLAGPGRSALLEIQLDEYGHGRPGEAHCELFARAMEELGLRSDFGAHVDRLPGSTLATDNLLSLFGLHRRLRGCLVGHLALFEMTSVTPMSRYAQIARRLGAMPSVERFFTVHVEADAHHGPLALEQLVGGFSDDEPDLRADIVFGAVALSRVEHRFARHLLRCWDEGRSSLFVPAPAPSPVAPARERLAG